MTVWQIFADVVLMLVTVLYSLMATIYLFYPMVSDSKTGILLSILFAIAIFAGTAWFAGDSSPAAGKYTDFKTSGIGDAAIPCTSIAISLAYAAVLLLCCALKANCLIMVLSACYILIGAPCAFWSNQNTAPDSEPTLC